MKTTTFYLTIGCICACIWSCQNATSATNNDTVSTETNPIIEVNPTIDLSPNNALSKSAIDSFITIRGRYFGAGLSADLKKATGGTEFQFITTAGDIYFVKYRPKQLNIATSCFDCMELDAKIIPMPPAEKYKMTFIEVLKSRELVKNCEHFINKDKAPVPFLNKKQLKALNEAEKAKGNKPFIIVSAEVHKAFRPASDIEYDYELKNWSENLEDAIFKGEPDNQTVFLASSHHDGKWNDAAHSKRIVQIVGRLRRGYAEHFHFEEAGIFLDEVIENTTFQSKPVLKNAKKYQIKYVSYSGDKSAFEDILSVEEKLAKNICGTDHFYKKDEKTGLNCWLSIDHSFVEKLPFATREKPHELTLQYQNGKRDTFKNAIIPDKSSHLNLTNYSRKINHVFIKEMPYETLVSDQVVDLVSGELLPIDIFTKDMPYETDPFDHIINLENGERLPIKGQVFVKDDMTELVEYVRSYYDNDKDYYVTLWKYYDGKYHQEWSHSLDDEELPNRYKWDKDGNLYATIGNNIPVKVEVNYLVKEVLNLDVANTSIPVFNWFPKEIPLPDFAKYIYQNISKRAHLPAHFFILIGADETGIWTLQGSNCSSATTLEECLDLNLVYSRYEGKEDSYKLENTDASGDKDIAAMIAQELQRLEKEKVLKTVKLTACQATTYENVLEVASKNYHAGKSFEIKEKPRVKGQVGCWTSSGWQSKN